VAASRLRITGGTARGVPITEPRGVRLRPTSGLVREAIFNILGDEVQDASVLDIYAGTGSLGLEALSRGARSAVFVEGEAASCTAIHASLARTGFTASAKVLRGRLPGALSAIEGPFDIILMDPPYADENAPDTLIQLAGLLAPGGVVVYEHGSRYNPPERPGNLQLTDGRVYGDSAIALYRHKETE